MKQKRIALANGDKKALRFFYDAYYVELCDFAVSYVKREDIARELVQGVFITIWEKRADLRVHSSMKAYLFQSVRNTALNYIRDEKTRRQAVDRMSLHSNPYQSRTAADRLSFKELQEVVSRAIDNLPERRRQAFVLHRHHDCTYREIAEIMGITKKTVENHIGRALKALREAVPKELR